MPPIIVPILLIGLLVFVLYRVKYSRRDKLYAKIPSPRKAFLLHNTPAIYRLSTDELFRTLHKWHSELGDVFHITLHKFDDGLIFVSDPKIAEVLSTHQPERSKALLYKPLSRWIGRNGFFLSKGEMLKNKMKIIANVFNVKMYERYLKIVNSQLNDAIAADLVCNDKMEFFSFAREGALDLVFEIVMGYKLNAKYGENKQYVDALIELTEIATKAALDPISRHSLLHPLTSLYRKERKVLKVLHDFTRKIVQDRRKELHLNSPNDGEFLQLNYYIQTPIDGVNYMSDEEIREELDTMILGAHDTTKSTFTFIMYNLAKFPEVQQRVFDEVKAFLEHDPKRELNEKVLANFPYLDAVIKETLRLYPPIPYLGRKLDTEVRTGGFTFPKNADIAISPFLAGRNKKYFADPLVFNPDRFYGIETQPLGYMPFSIGARKCMGGKLALMMLKIIIAKIVFNYKISLVPGHEGMVLSMEVTLGPLNGLYLNIKRRN